MTNKFIIPHIKDGSIVSVQLDADELVVEIYDKMARMREDNYEPKYLVIWEGYANIIVNTISNTYNHNYNPLAVRSEIPKIMGLKVIITQKLDTLEVY